jgi:7-methyl-GTP pyrophosphatase
LITKYDGKTMPMATSEVVEGPSIILASGSPFRKVILEKLKLEFTTAVPDIDESPLPNEAPKPLAARLALAKARALATRYPEHLIIGSDQVAMHGAKQLMKPGNRKNAIDQLRRISGSCVYFNTGVCVLDARNNEYLSEVDTCIVYFRRLTERQIEHYVDLDRPFQCAGGFKAESLGIALLERIKGDDPNALIGLPLIRLIRMLEAFGITVI